MNTTQSPNSCADDDPGLLRVEDARARMLDTVVPVRGYEQVGLVEAWRRVLHEPAGRSRGCRIALHSIGFTAILAGCRAGFGDESGAREQMTRSKCTDCDAYNSAQQEVKYA